MAITYEDVTPSLVPNTTMQTRVFDGVPMVYLIAPIGGYVLHDKTLDVDVMDEYGNPTGEVKRGYYPIQRSCGYNYDFSTVTITDENGVTHTGYGSREFFARPANEVPENQIYSLPDNDHEVM